MARSIRKFYAIASLGAPGRSNTLDKRLANKALRATFRAQVFVSFQGAGSPDTFEFDERKIAHSDIRGFTKEKRKLAQRLGQAFFGDAATP